MVCGLALYFADRKDGGARLALTLLTEPVAAVAARGLRDPILSRTSLSEPLTSTLRLLWRDSAGAALQPKRL